MTGKPDAPPAEPLAQVQQQIRELAEEILRLSLADLAAEEYFPEVLRRTLRALAAPAGQVWTRTPEGHFQPACQLNPGGIDLEGKEPDRDELLRRAIQQARPVYQPPQELREKAATDTPPVKGSALLVAPVLRGPEVVALLEVWLGAARDPQAMPGAAQFLVRVTDLAAVFLARAEQSSQPSEPELWAQLDAFTQRIHTSLHPTEVAFLVANEGRQLTGGDRLSVAVRRGRRAVIEAVSGTDQVDRRSNLVRRMRRLCDRILTWGETLVYRGVPDESLPPDVLRELDAYLEESQSKFLVVWPLRKPRPVQPGPRVQPPVGPAGAALLLECFTASVPPEQLLGRLEVIARHATSALGNAALHRDVPLRFLWQPVAWVQAGLGGKTKAIAAAVGAALLVLILSLLFIPYPLKMDAKGQLLPEQRRWIYTPVEGQVVRFEEGVEPGSRVVEGQALVLMYDVQLETKLVQLLHEVAAAQQDIEALGKQLNAATTEPDRLRHSADKKQKEVLRDRKFWELRTLRARTNAEEARPGHFWLKSPVAGTVLSWDFRETLTNRQVKPSEPLLRIGDKERRWEVELKIPQKHMGQITQAFAAGREELDVDLLVISAPTQTFKGKLARAKLAGEASPGRDDPNDAEPVVLASLRIDGPGIAPADRIPPELLIAGTEVHAKVRCGNHAMGYSLFYGVWEFFYEKVVFFF